MVNDDQVPEKGRDAGQRLTALDVDLALRPWRRAHSLSRCLLYWIPVSSFPAPVEQQQWLMLFFNDMIALLGKEFGFRVELFLQCKTIPIVMKAFMKTSREFSPVMGLSRRPGAALPPIPTKDALGSVARGEKEFDVKEWSPDYCYWFLKKAEKDQREEFFGYGGMTMMFLKPDPNVAPPPMPPLPKWLKDPQFMKAFEPETMAAAYALKDGLLPKSKALFGTGLEDEPQFPGLLFIVPLLSTQDFFSQKDEECDKWFQLFDVYVNESPADGGILMASKTDLGEAISGIVTRMGQKGLLYPER